MSSEILALWKKQPGKYFVLCTKSQTGKWREHWFTPYDFPDIKDFSKDNDDKDIYFCPHGFNRKIRKKEYVVAPKLLWADLDEATPHGMKPKPTVAIESSPGRYVGLWVVDKPVTDEINRQLTYLLDADHGGWDYTQVLRFPGTLNYKYKTTPEVRVLWDDGPIHKLENIVRLLPDYSKSPVEEAAVSLSAQDVYEKYEKVIPRWARKELLSGRPVSGARSEMLWKLEHELLGIGMTKDESFVLIKSSPWNKFRGRRNEDEQLKRELDKVVANKLDARLVAPKQELGKGYMNGHGPEPSKGFEILARRMSDIQVKEIDWLWYPYLAQGEVTIIEGDPGVGKSWVTQAIAKSICDGERLISVGKMKRVQGTVAYFDIENNAESVSKQRLMDMGLKNSDKFIQIEEVFSIDDEDKFEAVLDFLDEVKPKLVVFDTMNTYIGGADIFRSNEVAQAFGNFTMIARRFHCAVVVIRHLTKGGKEKAIYRGQGSMTFAGSARIVLSVGYHPEEEDQRVMAVTKLNLAKRPPALTYQLKETKGLRDKTEVVWGDFVDLTSEEILAPPEKKKEESKDEKAETMLQDMLKEGPRKVKEILQRAEKYGVSQRTMYKVAEEMNLVKRSAGFGKDKTATWELRVGIDRGH